MYTLQVGDEVYNTSDTQYCPQDIASMRSTSVVCNNTVSGFNGTGVMGSMAVLDWCIDGNTCINIHQPGGKPGSST